MRITGRYGAAMSPLLYFFCFTFWAAFAFVPAHAERLALVFGNSNYLFAPKLKNPKNDAADVAAALTKLGFEVSHFEDADSNTMRAALTEFGHRAVGAEIGAVFFAGHGMEVGGENWLFPKDANLQRDTDAQLQAINLKTVVVQVSGARKLGLVIIDACRNNPFPNMERSIGTRALDRGYMPPNIPVGNVLVAFSAKDGTTAFDGIGRNSPFTAALLKNLETSNLEIQYLFRAVRDDVMKMTEQNRQPQQPYIYGSLSKEPVYLNNAAIPSPPEPGFEISDLKNREAEKKAKWEKWQVDMKGDFDRTDNFNGDPELKIIAWDRFLKAYAQKNPYTNDDEKIRATATARRAALKELLRIAHLPKPAPIASSKPKVPDNNARASIPAAVQSAPPAAAPGGSQYDKLREIWKND